MLVVETEPIKAVVRLILREPTVSNFCKSWLYLKAMVENDDNIRLQLENGYNHWEFEGGINIGLLTTILLTHPFFWAIIAEGIAHDQ